MKALIRLYVRLSNTPLIRYMHARRRLCALILLIMMLGSALLITADILRERSRQQPVTAGININAANVQPFMHRPYYGSQTILQRTVSFMDHDKPWYEADRYFVRYDGKRWSNATVYNCDGGVNCYDGHNGYDLNLWFEPVLSVAGGTVTRANWYNPLNHNDAFGLWVAVDHGNGFVTAYGHLSAINVSVGDRVGTQWQIGTSGTTGSSTGPHLHLSAYYLPRWLPTDPFGWRANFANPNIVPDRYLWVSNPNANGTVPDLSAKGSAVYPGAVLVDDSDRGWSTTGDWARVTGKTDIKGNMHWTSASPGRATATATWQPALPGDGYYAVGVYVDEHYASSSWVPYTIYSADPRRPGVEIRHTVYIDQSHIGVFQGQFGTVRTGPQWVNLGVYYFRKAMKGRVVITNATGERNAQVGADAVEFVNINNSQATPRVEGYNFSVTANTTPTALTPGAKLPISLAVKNTGQVSWRTSGDSAVALGYRWQDSSGRDVQTGQVDTPGMTSIRQEVAPGGSVAVALMLRAPPLAGEYTLVIDMQYQGVWFSSFGTKPSSMKVTVTPDVPRTYYFAEGYTGRGTTEQLALTNLSAVQVTITLTCFYPEGEPEVHSYRVAAKTQRVLDINREIGANRSLGIMVQGDQPFIAERSMFTQKNGFVAATTSLGVTRASKTWYFAEGNTTFGWNTLLAVLNPGAEPVKMTLRYQLMMDSSGGQAAGAAKTYTLRPYSRTTLVLNNELPERQFGMAIAASSPIVVERAEYLVKSPMCGGSAVVGAPTLQKTWYFAGGNTTEGFIESLVLANPSSNKAEVNIRYLTIDGKVVTQKIQVPSQSRVEVRVNDEVGQTEHSTSISATIPIVVERQDFFKKGAISGSTTILASSQQRTSWYLAQGTTTPGRLETLNIAHGQASTTQIQIIYYRQQGEPIVKNYTLAGNHRLTIPLSREIGANEVVGMAIYAAAPLVVERTLFFSQQGASGGYACMAHWV
jgi:hypothetical protein